MKLFVSDTARSMAVRVADRLADRLALCMESTRPPLFCPASGDTPAELYREMHLRHLDKKLDVSDWFFVGLDEWVGMNGQDEGSCRHSLNRLLFHPLGVQEGKITFFDGKAEDLRAECLRIENFIADRAAIDVVVLGIGVNGHIAMNEPGISPGIRSHVTIIHPTTAVTGQKYFKAYRPLTRGITLGLATILEARHIFLLANGEHKAVIVHKALEGPVCSEVPASLLRGHPGLEVYLDAGAATLIQELDSDISTR